MESQVMELPLFDGVATLPPCFTATVKPARKSDTYFIESVLPGGTVRLIGDRSMLDFNIFTNEFRFLKEAKAAKFVQKLDCQYFRALSKGKPELSTDFVQWITASAIADYKEVIDPKAAKFELLRDPFPSRSWLVVPMRFIEQLGIKSRITPASRFYGINAYEQWVYLEEGQDITLFFSEYLNKYGFKPVIETIDYDEIIGEVYAPYPYFEEPQAIASLEVDASLLDLWYNVKYYAYDGKEWKETDQRPSDSEKEILASRITYIRDSQKKHGPGDGFHYTPSFIRAYFSSTGLNLVSEDSHAAIFAHAEDLCQEFGLDYLALYAKAYPTEEVIGLVTPEERAMCIRPATKDDVQAVLDDLHDINYHDFARVLEEAIADIQNTKAIEDFDDEDWDAYYVEIP